MGDKITLIEFNEIPESIPINNLHAQSPHGCYVVKIPVKDEEGHLEFRLALIARSNDICEGYLPYTRGNIIQQAFKLFPVYYECLQNHEYYYSQLHPDAGGRSSRKID
ncbi:hypothetical protein ES708_18337 [subsurface metagenome]